MIGLKLKNPTWTGRIGVRGRWPSGLLYKAAPVGIERAHLVESKFAPRFTPFCSQTVEQHRLVQSSYLQGGATQIRMAHPARRLPRRPRPSQLAGSFSL